MFDKTTYSMVTMNPDVEPILNSGDDDDASMDSDDVSGIPSEVEEFYRINDSKLFRDS